VSCYRASQYSIAIESWMKTAVCNKFYLQRSDYTLLIETLQCDYQIVMEMLQHFNYTLVIKTFNMPEEDYQSVIETLQIKFVAN